MLVGGSSGSTAGGVKTATVGVILLSAWSEPQARQDAACMSCKRPDPAAVRSKTPRRFSLLVLTAVRFLGAAFFSGAQTM